MLRLLYPCPLKDKGWGGDKRARATLTVNNANAGGSTTRYDCAYVPFSSGSPAYGLDVAVDAGQSAMGAGNKILKFGGMALKLRQHTGAFPLDLIASSIHRRGN